MYIEIPNNVQPYWSATINNKTYIYPAGTTQDVPEEVYNLIYNLQFSEEPHVGYSEQASDWNQNDPTATDYIKNRTHWMETEMISEDVKAGYGGPLRAFPMFDEGDTVTIYVDGVKYSLKARGDYLPDGNFAFIIGDSVAEIQANNGKYGWILFVNDGLAMFSANKDCTVSYNMETIHKIDPKYLPKVRPVEYCENESYLLDAFNELLGCLLDSGYMAYEDNGGGPV